MSTAALELIPTSALSTSVVSLTGIWLSSTFPTATDRVTVFLVAAIAAVVVVVAKVVCIDAALIVAQELNIDI